MFQNEGHDLVNIAVCDSREMLGLSKRTSCENMKPEYCFNEEILLF